MIEKERNREREMEYREGNEIKKREWNIGKEMAFTECHSLLSILFLAGFDNQ